LANLSATPIYDLDKGIEAIDFSSSDAVVVLTEFIESKKNMDIDAWKSAMLSLENSLNTLMKNKGRNIELNLYNCSGDRFYINKSLLRSRFWKRNRKIEFFSNRQ
jgi:hypothetical protein